MSELNGLQKEKILKIRRKPEGERAWRHTFAAGRHTNSAGMWDDRNRSTGSFLQRQQASGFLQRTAVNTVSNYGVLPELRSDAGSVSPGLERDFSQVPVSTRSSFRSSFQPPTAGRPVVMRLLDRLDQPRLVMGQTTNHLAAQAIARKVEAPATLRHGSTGPAVEELQQHLNRHGAAPPLKVDGIFGPKTLAGVKGFQNSHSDAAGKPLVADGIVGPLTWGALQKSAPKKDPDGAIKASKEVLQNILAKGNAMTPDEAAQAKKILFSLEGDEFRAVLKKAIASGAFLAMLSKLDFSEILDVLSNITQEVVIATTLLKPATDTIKDDFKRANEIYNPHGIEIEQGNHIDLSEKATKKLLGGDTSLDEFTTDKATAEELKLMEMNRMSSRISGYWVPDMTSSRGEALIKDDLKNMKDGRTSVVVNTSNRAQDTFAHEVGHILGLDHEGSDPKNLMAPGAKGGLAFRKITGPGIDKLTDAQLAIIRKSLFMEFGRKGVGK